MKKYKSKKLYYSQLNHDRLQEKACFKNDVVNMAYHYEIMDIQDYYKKVLPYQKRKLVYQKVKNDLKKMKKI